MSWHIVSSLTICTLLLVACSCEGDSFSDDDADPALLGDVPLRTLVEINRITEPPLGSITQVRVDSRGHVYVVDGQTQEILEFTPSGAFVRRFGGEGQGPGEFRFIRQMRVLPGDTLLILDGLQTRLTWWPAEAASPSHVNTLESILGAEEAIPTDHGFIIAEHERSEEDGTFSLVYHLVNHDLAVESDTVLTLQGDQLIEVEGSGWGYKHPSPLLYDNQQDATNRHLFRAWTGEPQLEVYDHTPTLLRTIPLPHRPEPVTTDDIRRVQEESTPPEDVVSQLDEVTRLVRNAIRETAHDYWPSIRDVVADEGGNAWVGLRGKEGDPIVWLQVTPEGEFMQRIELPWDVQLEAVHDKRVYARTMDEEAGGPVVVAYELVET